MLARYTSPSGALREVVGVDGAAGCVLVIDRDRITREDARLVAHLGADEPTENAASIAVSYADDAAERVLRCRRVLAKEFTAAEPDECFEAQPAALGLDVRDPVFDRLGRAHSLEATPSSMSIPELRWRCRPPAPLAEARTVSVRAVVARVEAYEPVRALTRHALRANADRDDLSVATLRLEFERMVCSPIVLNRKLRETVLASIAEQRLSMSEIAIRCGRVKRDRLGNVSGETSWLGRRIGLLPEGGREQPTPWVHSEVLALIARRGLGVSPREVEPD
jgi:hypothetical protein